MIRRRIRRPPGLLFQCLNHHRRPVEFRRQQEVSCRQQEVLCRQQEVLCRQQEVSRRQREVLCRQQEVSRRQREVSLKVLRCRSADYPWSRLPRQ
jgi:hypothetical protein